MVYAFRRDRLAPAHARLPPKPRAALRVWRARPCLFYRNFLSRQIRAIAQPPVIGFA